MKASDDMPSDATPATLLAHAFQPMHDADALRIATCARLGVESGLPDFQELQSSWPHYPRASGSRSEFREMASQPNPGFAPMRHWGKPSHWAGRGIQQRHRKAVPEGRVPARRRPHSGTTWLAALSALRAPCIDLIWHARSFAAQVEETRCSLLGHRNPAQAGAFFKAMVAMDVSNDTYERPAPWTC